MAGLDLVPNSVVGYRIRAEWLNWVVVLVKRHGAQSRVAGQEYDTAVGYYKDLEQAARAALRLEIARLAGSAQDTALQEQGTCAETQALLDALPGAAAQVGHALHALHASIRALGGTEAQARRALAAQARGSAATDEPAATAADEPQGGATR